MKNRSYFNRTASLFSVLGKPFRLRILLAIGEGEACVCHLEALLQTRQAYISQHLMALRKAGLLDTRRYGKFVFYRLRHPELLPLLEQAGRLAGITEDELAQVRKQVQAQDCCCPHCQKEGAVCQQTQMAAMQPEEHHDKH